MVLIINSFFLHFTGKTQEYYFAAPVLHGWFGNCHNKDLFWVFLKSALAVEKKPGKVDKTITGKTLKTAGRLCQWWWHPKLWEMDDNAVMMQLSDMTEMGGEHDIPQWMLHVILDTHYNVNPLRMRMLGKNRLWRAVKMTAPFSVRGWPISIKNWAASVSIGERRKKRGLN